MNYKIRKYDNTTLLSVKRSFGWEERVLYYEEDGKQIIPYKNVDFLIERLRKDKIIK